MTRSVNRTTDDSERALLDYLQRPGYEPLPQRRLMHRLQIGPEDRPRFRKLIARLIEQGKVRKGRLDDEGRARIPLPEPVDVQISFPRLDAEAWERSG